MAGPIVDDSVVETATTTGTGDFTLAGAVTGFKTFADVCAVGDRVYYLIEGIDGSGDRTGEWETGYGTYSGANTLARTTVQKSSNANAAVDFSAGTKRVMIALTAGMIAWRGCVCHKNANLTAQNLTSASVITWDTDLVDTHAFHDVGSNPERITVPAGVGKKFRLRAQVTLANHSADGHITLEIRKNGSAAYHGVGKRTVEVGSTTPSIAVETAVLSLLADGTEYFEVYITVESDTSSDITAIGSWFEIEVVE